MTSTRAGLYLRISDDREGQAKGVRRQEQDCTALAGRLGWAVAECYTENDVSAFRGRPRPEYQRMLADVRERRIDAVAVYDVDRLTRHPSELESFISLVEATGARLASVSGEIDLGHANGRLQARVVGAFARHESERKAERIQRKALELAQDGKVSGGGTRPFGFDDDRVTVRPDEAALIREAAARALAGEGVRSLVRDFNDRGILTTAGKPWRAMTMRRMLMSARIAGQREHHHQVVADAVWPAIVSKVESARLRAMLGDPARRVSPGTARKYLLSTIAKCGHCGSGMVGRPRDDGTPRYVCNRDSGGCGRTFILTEPADQLVTAMVLEALNSPEMDAAMRRSGSGRDDGEEVLARLDADEAKLADLARDFGTGLITRAEWLAARDAVAHRLESARRGLAQQRRTTALAELTGTAEELRRRWDGLGLDRRRAVLSAVVDAVVVGPGRPGFNKFDAGRVSVRWRF